MSQTTLRKADVMTADGAFSYAVVRVGDEWRVVCARKAMGHFVERDQAVSAASALAAEAAREGRRTEVLIQSETGELKSAWRSQSASGGSVGGSAAQDALPLQVLEHADPGQTRSPDPGML